jgi:UDP-GlcNAc:undecaprenyl-phosphate GlcNAc-1-phosphate transferase
LNLSNETASILVFALATLVALVATPTAAMLARHWGLADRPSPRKSHRTPVALLGGVSVLVALMAGAMAALLLPIFQTADSTLPPNEGFFVGCGVGGLLLATVGLWDDLRPLSISSKLGAQLLAAVSFAWCFDFQSAGHAFAWAVAAVCWLVLISNAFNLVDNMDGAASGVGVVIAGCLAVLIRPGLVEFCAVALAGALVGFLVFNWHPARVFLGDGGSLPIGFLLAATGLWLASSGGALLPLATILIFGVPLLDTSLVVVSRLRRKQNPLKTPGRDHLSHRLVFLGLSVSQAVLVVWSLALVFGAGGLVVARTEAIGAWWIIASAMLLCAGIIVSFERFAPTGLAPVDETPRDIEGDPWSSPEDPSAAE